MIRRVRAENHGVESCQLDSSYALKEKIEMTSEGLERRTEADQSRSNLAGESRRMLVSTRKVLIVCVHRHCLDMYTSSNSVPKLFCRFAQTIIEPVWQGMQ